MRQTDDTDSSKFDRRLAFAILSLAKPEAKMLSFGLIFLALGSAMMLVYPQAMRAIVDEALTTKNISAVNKWATVLLLVTVIQAAAASIRYYLFTLAGERTVIRLRERLYSNILNQETAFFDFHKTGELMSRLSADSAVLQNAVSVNISMGLRNLVGAIGGFVLLVLTSPRLAAIVLIVVPPVAAAAGMYGRKIRGFSKTTQDALAEASTVAEETISGIRTVRFFAQESYENSRYRSALTKALEASRNRIKQVSLFAGFASAFGYAAIAGVLWVGGREVVTERMSVGDLTQFILYLGVVAFSVAALGGLWGDFMSAMGAARRVFQILERRPAFSNQEGRRLDFVKGEVTFENISFSYPTRTDIEVLKCLSFEILPGCSVALVGTSGSGKTTVASLLTRLYDPSFGRVLLDGLDLRDLEADWLRRQIGVVSQEPILISTTIEENIRYANPTASPEDVERAARIANAHEFITRFPDQYQTVVGERGIQLSGGQKQRVAIARAVLKDPKILILDEATSALDTENEALVQDALKKLMQGRTTLIIAHRLATIRDADQILVLEDGHVIETGTHQDLIRSPQSHYSKLINKQFVT